jgi:hypothetical protein
MPTTILRIGTTDYDGPARDAADLRLVRLQAPNLDGPESLEFAESRATLPGTFPENTPVVLTIDGVARFRGIISGRASGESESGISISYSCLGLSDLADTVPVTQPQDGSTEWTFNRRPDDPDYIPTEAGLSVGQILADILTAPDMAGDLSALGIGAYTSLSPPTLPAATVADLAALTIVPPEPVTVSGNQLWATLKTLLGGWQRNHVLLIDPADGTIRVLDTTAFADNVLTIDSDPIGIPALSRSIRDCATRVIVLGSGDVEPFVATLLGGELDEDPAWVPYEADWTIADFTGAGGGSSNDTGTVSAVTSTTVDVHSDDATLTAAANRWSGLQAYVQLLNPAATGISYSETRPITANTAMTAGGTMTLTLGYPLADSGYTKYRIFAASSPRSLTYRDYIFTDPYVAAHLVKRFPVPVSWSYGGRGVSGTVDYPAAGVQWEQVVVPATFDLLPLAGKIRFHEPTVMVYSSKAQLQAGGSGVVKPDDLIVMVPVNRGNLTAVEPPDVGGVAQYEGTASLAPIGLHRTLTIPVPSWAYRADLANMQSLARMYLDSTKDVLIEGSVAYYGYYAPGLEPGNAVSLHHPTLITGYETLRAPIRSCVLEWPQAGGALWMTTLQVSNRRNPYSGDRLWVHEAFCGSDWGSDLDYAEPAEPHEPDEPEREAAETPDAAEPAEAAEPWLPEHARDAGAHDIPAEEPPAPPEPADAAAPPAPAAPPKEPADAGD